MKIKLLAYIFIFVGLSAHGQNYFQKYLHTGYKGRGVQSYIHETNETIFLTTLVSCYDPFGNAHCENFGLFGLGNYFNLNWGYEYNSITKDTSLSGKSFFKSMGGKYSVIGGAVTKGFYYPAFFKVDSNFNIVSTTALQIYPGFGNLISLNEELITLNIYACGILDTNLADNTNDIFISKLDSNLNPIWLKSLSSEFQPEIAGFKLLSSGDLFIFGGVTDTSHFGRAWILKMDSAGNIIWSKKYSTLKFSTIANLYELFDGFIIAGTCYDSTFNYGSLYISKLDTNGNVIWANKYFSLALNQNQFLRTKDGNYLLSATYNNYGNIAASILKTDSNGNIISHYYYPDGAWNLNIIELDSSNYCSVGRVLYTTLAGDSCNIWIARMDAMLRTGCNEYSYNIIMNSNNEFNVINQPAYVSDYPISIFSLPVIRDTAYFYEEIICDNTVGIFESKVIQGVSIYPNPSTGKLNIEFGNINIQDYLINIYDLNGYRVYSNSVIAANHNALISINNLDSGIYIFELISNENVFIKRLVKI